MTESGLTQEVEPKNLHMYLLSSLLFHILKIYATQSMTLFLIKRTIMVNFMCQLDWTTKCWDIWLNTIQGVSVRVILDETKNWIKGLSKADCPSPCRGPHPICGKSEKYRRLSKERICSLCVMSFEWDISVFLPSDSNSHPELYWSSSIWMQILGHFSLYNHMSQFLIYLQNYLSLYLFIIYLLSLYLYLYISVSILILWALLLGEPCPI